jgi:hypothetical protein
MPTQSGKGFFGWLGRQVGFVKKAVQTDPGAEKKLFEKKRVEEAPHPENPNIKLRRTVIDEAIEQKKKDLPRMNADEHR